jgi:Fe(3+) dicitrate transport protein
LSRVKPFGIDLKLRSTNYAAFAENIFQLSKQFSITPGERYELIDTKMDGVINNGLVSVSYSIHRSLPLFGTGLQYEVSKATELYANISRPTARSSIPFLMTSESKRKTLFRGFNNFVR